MHVCIYANKPPSDKNWLPENTNHTTETFIDLTFKEINIEKAKCNPTKERYFMKYQNAMI